jgi:surface antigen
LGQFVAAALLLSACAQEPERIVLIPPSAPDAPVYEASLQSPPPTSRQCVPYARYLSGINLQGDAFTWWEGAAGRYLRGQQPMPGAVLVLSRSDRLSRGHLAVVRQVIDGRRILVDHANWKPGEVTSGMAVADVSPNNDWSELRFFNEEAQSYGSVYPANGFIYNLAEAPADGIAVVSGSQAYLTQ